MKRSSLLAVLAVLPAATPSAVLAAETPAKPASWDQALVGGKPTLALRARVEEVDEDAFARDAVAQTLRIRLGYESAGWRGWSVGGEVDHLLIIGGDAFNSTRNGRTTRPQVPDPDGTDLNLAFLKYATANEEVVIGRQRLGFDNTRFIGSVAWRQNEQTFDALTLRSKRWKKLQLTYSFVDNVNRVFGPDAGTPPPDLRSQLHLLNAGIELGKAGKLSLFHYSMRFDNAANLSQATSGFYWTGRAPLGKSGWAMPWAASWASQQDAGANPINYSAPYYQAELGLARDPFAVRLGREVLSGDPSLPERRFQTPLATLHLFQGWADKFLATPPQGIEDNYIAATFKRKAWDVQLVWHDYDAEAVSRSYGSEWNLSVGYKFRGHTDLLAKVASYDADGFGTDTTKFWLQVSREFKAK